MEIGEHDEVVEIPSPMSSSFMPSSMHDTTATAATTDNTINNNSSNIGTTGTTNIANSAKMKVVLNNNGAGVHHNNGILSGNVVNNNGISNSGPASHVIAGAGIGVGIHSVGNIPSSAVNIHAHAHGVIQDDVRVPASMELKVRKPVKYRECLKNHAANLGGHATDGCGEFMPSGEEGTIEALTCAACNCHRNFHRREVEGEQQQQMISPQAHISNAYVDCRFHDRKNPPRLDTRFPSPLPLSSPTLLSPPPHMIMAFNPNIVGAPDSLGDKYDTGLLSPQSSSLKKRFRTKFTQEQKDQMASFAQKLGWRIQKHDEEAVQQFCAEIGVKRHVLKVWMHNNKTTVGKKLTGCLTMTPENPEI